MLVVKYGGNAMGGGADAFIAECAELVREGQRIVLVHGGGPQIDIAVKKAGISERRVAGLRVTDEATLLLTEHVLCGQVNKALVRAFAARGVRAAGVSGQDGNMLTAAPIAPIEGESLGFVGEVRSVDTSLILCLLQAGFVPVIAPLGISADGLERYNLNADTAAGAIAGALKADPYVVVTDVPRVRRNPRDPQSGIDSLTLAEARVLLEAGAFDGGMRPKMLAVFTALEAGATRAVVAGGERALHKALAGDGTTVVRE
jgi:acetylglutamate kinase